MKRGGGRRKQQESSGRGGKKKALGSRVPWGTQSTTPGQGVRNKAAAPGQSALAVSAEGALRGRRGPLGMPPPLRPGRALRRRLPSPGPPERTSGDCARGARGRTGEPGADHSGEDVTKQCSGLRPVLALRKEILGEELPGGAGGGPAWDVGSWPQSSRAAVRSPTDARGARVSGRKRLSHFLRSPYSSAPSAPELPSLSSAPFPKPTAHVGAGKTRNLNGCPVRHLPPHQIRSRCRNPACLPLLPTISRAPGRFPIGRAHPVPELWSFPLLGRVQS